MKRFNDIVEQDHCAIERKTNPMLRTDPAGHFIEKFVSSKKFR